MGSSTISKTIITRWDGVINHNYVIENPLGASILSQPYFRVTATYRGAGENVTFRLVNNAYESIDFPGSAQLYTYRNGLGAPVHSSLDLLPGANKFMALYDPDNDGILQHHYGEKPVDVVISAKWGETPEAVQDCEPWAKSVKVTLFADVNGTRQASKKTCALSDNGETQVNFDSSDFGGEDYSLLGVRVYNDTPSRLPDGFGYRVNLKVTKQMTPVNFFEDIFTGLTIGDWGEEIIGIGNTPHDNLGFKDLGGRNSNNVSNEFFPRYLREVQVILNKVSYSEEPVCPAPITPDKPDEEFEEEHSEWFPEPVAPVQPVEPVEPVAPVQPVEPVEPVQPVEPVEPVQPIVIIKGADDDCCEKTIAVLNELNSTIYKSSLSLTASLERIVEKLDIKNKQDIFIANSLNEQNVIIADSINSILSKMFTVMLYTAFMKSAEVVDNAIDTTGQFEKLITAIEQALNVNTDDTKMSISEVLLSKDNITFNDVNVESLLDKDIEIKEFLK